MASLVLAGLSVAQQHLTLPPEYHFSEAVDSPGEVTFRHESHVDMSQPDCTVCHPRLFRILEPGTPTQGGSVSHDDMEAGRQCGACHNGEAAFPQDQCMVCHQME